MREKSEIWFLGHFTEGVKTFESFFGHTANLQFITSLASFIQLLKERTPTILVVTLNVDDGNFLNFLGSAESSVLTSPFIVILPTDDLDVLRYCYGRGARTCLSRPFNKAELIVKIERALSEIVGPISCEKYLKDDVFKISKKYFLTHKEAELLSLFMESHQNIVSREDIMQKLWGGVRVTHKTLDVHLYNLRKKISGSPFDIKSQGPGTWTLLINHELI